MFTSGQKVVCVDATNSDNHLVKDETYIVHSMVLCGMCQKLKVRVEDIYYRPNDISSIITRIIIENKISQSSNTPICVNHEVNSIDLPIAWDCYRFREVEEYTEYMVVEETEPELVTA